MEAQINLSKIMDKLAQLQADVNFIKNNIIDVDCILTKEDREALTLADEEFKQGKTISHEELKKELGV